MGNLSAFVPSFDKPEQVGVSTSTDSLSFSQPPRKPPTRAKEVEALLTAEDVAKRLNVSTDWVGTIRPERNRSCRLFEWAMVHSAIAPAESRPSSMKGSG
jgi:hypothetical protein